MKNPNYLCPGCMSEWGHPNKPCPHCGFVEKNYNRPPRWLPLRNVLNGKYMIGKVIGEGGFGITYLGWDLNLQVRVAIKEYFPVGLATRENGAGTHSILALPGVRQENYKQGLEKFMTEAKNLSKFYNLKGIVAVRDFFFENDTAYMVMEYVDGVTLGTYLKNHGGQLSEQEVLQLFHPVMESLKVVHQAGIIHRDISPDNIMMTKDGKMKLIDFGAARFAGGDTERSLTIILKHGYAPAEQYQSHGNQGPWTDVYAICATMYRMITGKVPPSAMDRIHEDLLEEFSDLGFRVSDKSSYALLDKGLAIRVEDRYQNMDQLIQGLYGLDHKKIRRQKKKSAQVSTTKILLCSCVGVLVLGFILGGIWINGRNSQLEHLNSNESGDSNVANHTSIAEEIETVVTKEPLSVTKEQLLELHNETKEKEKKFVAKNNQIMVVRDDGSILANGTNNEGNLNVTKWTDITAVALGDTHTLGLKKDGTVIAVGETESGKCAVETWKDIVKISASANHSLGLKSDGSVYAAGSITSGIGVVSDWEDIVDIAAGDTYSLGLKPDGTVLVTGREDAYEFFDENEWHDVIQIETNGNISAGLKSDGTVVLTNNAGEMSEAENWGQVISVKLGQDYIAGLLSNKTVVVAGDKCVTQEKVEAWTEIEALAAADQHLFGLKSDGNIVRTTYSYGNGTKEELTGLKQITSGNGYLAGLKSDGTVIAWGISGKDFGLEEVSTWENMKELAGCPNGLLGLTNDGTVLALGDDYKDAEQWQNIESIAFVGSSAVGLQNNGRVVVCSMDNDLKYSFEEATDIKGLIPGISSNTSGLIKADGTIIYHSYYNMDDIKNVVSATSGQNHIVTVHEDGTVSTMGNAAKGLGNVYGWSDVKQSASGMNHILCLKNDGTVYATGDNSNGQCNVSDWTDVVYVAAGEHYSLGIQTDGSLLIAGKIPGEY